MSTSVASKPCSETITKLNQALLFKILDSLDGTKTIVWGDRLLMNEINSVCLNYHDKSFNIYFLGSLISITQGT